ncbi:MAG: hypothetical protein EBQ56_15720 [Proteobacteria bacterium]|nr:hypothetical protein [Pseudomonadota bacterium]
MLGLATAWKSGSNTLAEVADHVAPPPAPDQTPKAGQQETELARFLSVWPSARLRRAALVRAMPIHRRPMHPLVRPGKPLRFALAGA